MICWCPLKRNAREQGQQRIRDMNLLQRRILTLRPLRKPGHCSIEFVRKRRKCEVQIIESTLMLVALGPQTSVSGDLLVPLRLLTHRLVRCQSAEQSVHCPVVVRNIRPVKRHAALLPPAITQSHQSLSSTEHEHDHVLSRLLPDTPALRIVVLIQCQTPCILNHALHVLDPSNCVCLRRKELLRSSLGSLHRRQHAAVLHAGHNEENINVVPKALLHLSNLQRK